MKANKFYPFCYFRTWPQIIILLTPPLEKSNPSLTHIANFGISKIKGQGGDLNSETTRCSTGVPAPSEHDKFSNFNNVSTRCTKGVPAPGEHN